MKSAQIQNNIVRTDTSVVCAYYLVQTSHYYEAGNVDDVKIKCAIQNYDSLDFMRKKACGTYEDFFNEDFCGLLTRDIGKKDDIPRLICTPIVN